MRKPKPHCLVRNYSVKKFPSFYDSKTIQKILLRSKTFQKMERLIEGAPHGMPHFLIGGKGGDFVRMMSPNDPFFWLHHAYLDKLWNDWQAIDGGKNFSKYGGKHRGKRAKATDKMKPWKLEISKTFDIKNYCYRYAEFSGKATAGQPPPKAPKPVVIDGETVEPIDEKKELRAPPSLPDSFIDHHKMDIEKFKKDERFLQDLMRQENNQPPPTEDEVLPDDPNTKSLATRARSATLAILLIFLFFFK